MPVDCGSLTPSSAQAATAASTALPSDFSTSIAVSAACGCEVATIAFWAWTVDRPAKWKFLITGGSLYLGFGGEFRKNSRLHDTFVAASPMAGMPENARYALAAMASGFPLPQPPDKPAPCR